MYSPTKFPAVFLSHLRYDHCRLFSLIMMPHKVEVITTRTIFNMAMEKLSCNPGWKAEVMREVPQLNYFLRRLRTDAHDASVDWLLGKVTVY